MIENLKKEIEIKKELEISELKNRISKIKNSLNGPLTKMRMREEQICWNVETTIEIIKFQEESKGLLEGRGSSLGRGLWENVKMFNIFFFYLSFQKEKR